MVRSLFFMRLNTAGVVIGWFGVLKNFVAIIVEGIALGYADVIAHQVMENTKNSTNNAYDYEGIHMAIIIILSIALALGVISFLAAGMLIFGIMRERHLMLLPWLINSGIEIAFSMVLGLVGAIVSPFESGSILGLLLLALNIYIFMGIYALFKQMQLARDQQHPLIQQKPTQANNGYPNYTKM